MFGRRKPPKDTYDNEVLAEARLHMWNILAAMLLDGEITPEQHALWVSDPLKG